jgi:hypothetical protein
LVEEEQQASEQRGPGARRPGISGASPSRSLEARRRSLC